MNRNFILLTQGQLVSQLGSQLFTIAAILWVKELTGAATMVGLLGALGALPALLISPLAGVLADRYSRRSIIIWTDVLRGLALLPVAWLALTTPEDERWVLGALFSGILISSLMGSFFEPAISSILPDIVPEKSLGRANSIQLALSRIIGLLGPGIGGVAYRIVGAPILFLANSLSYFFSAASEAFLKIPKEEEADASPRQPSTIKDEMLEGLRYIWHRTGLRSLLLIGGAMNFMITPILILLPFYVEETLGARADWYGFLMASLGVGSLGGYALMGVVSLSPNRRGRLVTASLLGIAIGCTALGFTHDEWIATAIFFGLGVLQGIFNVTNRTLLQISSPRAMLGRIFSAVGLLTRALSPLAMALAGVVADFTDQNIPLIYIVCGSVLIALALIAQLNPTISAFLSQDPQGGGESTS